MMNKRKLLTTLLRRVEQRSINESVNLMWEQGLLDKRAVERLYINSEVERRVRAGEVKTRAMQQLSDELGCSYEKVRAVVYNK
jgi:hypothetical protein